MKITLAILAALLSASAGHASNGPFLDTTYGSAGIAHFAVQVLGHTDDVLQSATFLDDGSLMVAGYAFNETTPLSSTLLAMKFLPTGTVDTTFGTGNVVQLPAFSGGGIGDLALISGGKVAVIGEFSSDGETSELTIGRLGSDGAPDTSFNFSGFRGITPGTFGPVITQVIGRRVLPSAEGKLLGLGYATDNVTTACAAVVRVNTDGNLDTSFATTGNACFTTDVTTKPVFYAFDMALQADGKIVIVGTGNHGNVADNFDLAVLRLLDDGTVDTSFGDQGWAFVAFDLGGGLQDMANVVSIDASGRILIVGTAANASGNDLVAARLLPTGQIDTSFGVSGRLDVPTSYNFGSSVTVLQDGRILVVASGASGSEQFGLFMFKSNGSIDASFGVDGFYTQSGGAYVLNNAQRLQMRGDYLYLPGFAVSNTTSDDTEFGVARLIQPIFADGFDGSPF